jgi:ADP-ribose pyrophosphatase YjhB (NUDIX family)
MPLRKIGRIVAHGLQRLQHIGNRLVRPLTMGVRAVVIDDGRRVFLVRQTYTPGWHLPGGGVEPGETIFAALERELREEGNIEIEGDPELHGLFFNRHATERDHVAVFVVRRFRQIAPRGADWEILETGFFPLDALPAGATHATRARLQELFDGAARSHHW